MTNTIIRTEIVQEVKETIVTDLNETVKFLNRCGGFGNKSKEEKEKYEKYVKIASGKGKSIGELKNEIEKSKKKLIKALKVALVSDEKEVSLEQVTKSLNIIAETILEGWEFYSENTRDFLKILAVEAKKFTQNTKTEDLELISEKVTEHKKAIQRFYNAVFGYVEWKNCETELGRKLIKIREKIILSGEPLMNQDEFDKYIEEIKKVNEV